MDWKQIKSFPSALFFMYFLTYAACAARSAENFVSHRFYEFGIPMALIPLVNILIDLPWFLVSLFLVKKLDHVDFKKMFLSGVGFLFLANTLMMSTNLYSLVLGCISSGIFTAIMQGVLLTQVAKFTSKDIRGTAFALYYIIQGLGFFTSIKMTGYFAHTFNTWRAGFLAQSVISFALIFLVILIPKKFFKAKG